MEKYVCVVCGWVYDEAVEGVKFEDQPDELVLDIQPKHVQLHKL